MQKRRTGTILLGVFVVALLGVAGWFLLAREITLLIPREVLQQQLEAAFPYEKRELLYAVSVRDPKLQPSEKPDRIRLSLNVGVGVLGSRKISGVMTSEAGVRYDANQTAFFLENPRVTDISIRGLPRSIARQIPQVATAALQAVVKNKPIYQMTDADRISFALRRTLKSVKFRNGQLEATLGVR
jgi:hypothetical protein